MPERRKTGQIHLVPNFDRGRSRTDNIQARVARALRLREANSASTGKRPSSAAVRRRLNLD